MPRYEITKAQVDQILAAVKTVEQAVESLAAAHPSDAAAVVTRRVRRKGDGVWRLLNNLPPLWEKLSTGESSPVASTPRTGRRGDGL